MDTITFEANINDDYSKIKNEHQKEFDVSKNFTVVLVFVNGIKLPNTAIIIKDYKKRLVTVDHVFHPKNDLSKMTCIFKSYLNNFKRQFPDKQLTVPDSLIQADFPHLRMEFESAQFKEEFKNYIRSTDRDHYFTVEDRSSTGRLASKVNIIDYDVVDYDDEDDKDDCSNFSKLESKNCGKKDKKSRKKLLIEDVVSSRELKHDLEKIEMVKKRSREFNNLDEAECERLFQIKWNEHEGNDGILSKKY